MKNAKKLYNINKISINYVKKRYKNILMFIVEQNINILNNYNNYFFNLIKNFILKIIEVYFIILL